MAVLHVPISRSLTGTPWMPCANEGGMSQAQARSTRVRVSSPQKLHGLLGGRGLTHLTWSGDNLDERRIALAAVSVQARHIDIP